MPRGAPSPDLIHLGDNLPFMRRLPDASIDLIYLDPPFNTGSRKTGSRKLGRTSAAFADSWDSIDRYLDFIRPRAVECRRLLKPTGSLLLHCDWRAGHHLRLLVDDIFGPQNFVNHLIWRYGLGGSSPRSFARKHDDILFYARTDRYYFKPPMVPATSARMRGRLKKCTDILDIPSINNMADERTGYPTQKPLALLELLVSACSPPSAVVADFFCGSGTTLVAAKNLVRRVIACDRSPRAVRLTRKRLKQIPRSMPRP